MRYCLILFILLSTVSASAEFGSVDHFTTDFASGGNAEHLHWTLTAATPIAFIDGYAGVQWLHARDDGEESANHLKARIEGGHTFGWLAIRAYGRYGRQSVMEADSVLHGGGYLEARLHDSIQFGIGTWAEGSALADFGVGVGEGDPDGVDFGLRGHLNVHYKWVSILVEYLPHHDFSEYTIRVPITVEIPITRIVFVEQLSAVLTGGVDYYSETHSADIEQIQYYWAHALRWRW